MKQSMYLSVSLLCLSLAFLVVGQLRQPNAEASGVGSRIICMTHVDSRNEVWVAVEPADIYKCSAFNNDWSHYGTIPGGKTIAAMSQSPDGHVWVVLEDGQWGYISTTQSFFEWHSTGSPNIFGGGPVSVEPTTWGTLKQQFVK